LELAVVGGNTAFRIVPLVEGIEYLKLEYGVDDAPGTANTTTGLIGDATVNSYTALPADWTTVIASRVYILARNTEGSLGFVDDKTYNLGTVSVPAFNDNVKRHVYQAEVRLTNVAGRREIP
jgi:type IV pilus assembly protein PilW